MSGKVGAMLAPSASPDVRHRPTDAPTTAMQPAATPPTEAERIATLRSLLLLDTPAEDRFDVITAYAAALFQVQIALVSLVDSDRQWFKSSHGLDVCETTREVSFCAHAILRQGVFEIPDARQDPRFVDNPLVTGAPFIRFYASHPLTMRNGERVGTLCLLDSRPRALSAWEREQLVVLARLVVAEMEGRSDAEDPGAAATREAIARGALAPDPLRKGTSS